MTKRISLDSLLIENFKGIKRFELNANSANVNVFGDNATGKTTIFDAFTWVLFDKDSADKKDFQLKTVDVAGKEQHHLDHSVAVSFLVDGRPLELQKVFKEKWTKKRGSATSEFSGHTNDYFVNGVPAKKKEFDETVSDLVSSNENLFKLITSPTYFNEQLNWKQRRKVLLGVCGNLTDEDVIASNKELADLPNILDGHDIEDLRKIIAAKRKEINQELERIPIRIDEATKSKPELDGQSEAGLTAKAADLQEQINSIDDKISAIRSGGEVDKKRNEIRKIEGIQLDLRNNFQKGIHEEIDEKRSKYFAEKSDHDQYLRTIADRKEEIKSNERRIKQNGEKAEELRLNWASEDAKQFEFTGETVCAACGQELPVDRVEDAKTHAEAEFNRIKAKKLEEIQRQGKELVEEIKRLNRANEENGVDVAQFGESADVTKKVMDNLQEQIDKLNAGTKSIMDDPEYQQTQKQIKTLELEIKGLQASTDDAIMAENEKKRDLKGQLASTETALLKFDSARRIDKRIAELEEHEKRLAKEFERTEYELNLTEEFIKTKVNLLEDRINSKFKMARFKLFAEQINGGLNEVCETTYQGVPYNALNNAAKINVGLDIINTLSEFKGLSAPIFIDNREAVTKLIDIDAQIISLIVSEADKQLRVEQEEKPVEEAVI
ncbi:ATP-binding protein [Sporolactobacillus terrae]|uniref:ATP-binding protein n=1 Tax=Sporolactobacillus terrae TaxID=269673 RepID=UPI001CBF4DD3|nr:ATP-binding protein [Sporolactobacillus terrae]UAK17588.1 AAA family ATPase [Sporolactobacillus terrae]